MVARGAETECTTQLREQIAVPDKPKNQKHWRADWVRDVLVWIKLVVDPAIKPD